jgi:hypothetical protein
MPALCDSQELLMSVIRKSSVLAIFFLFALAVAAHADQQVMKVKVPFPFVVRGEVMPPGAYDLTSDDAGAVIWIRGETGEHAPATVVLTTAVSGNETASAQPALVFIKHENQYRLSEIREYGMTRKAEF